MWNSAVIECIQYTLTDGRRRDQLKLNLLRSPLNKHSDVFTQSNGDVSRCKLYIFSMTSRNVPKAAHSFC